MYGFVIQQRFFLYPKLNNSLIEVDRHTYIAARKYNLNIPLDDIENEKIRKAIQESNFNTIRASKKINILSLIHI